MVTDENAKWIHVKGDAYRVVQCQYVGNERVGFGPQYTLLAGPFGSRKTAWQRGTTILGHDDFNLAATRRGTLAAMLWNEEVVDDGVDVLNEVARQTGITPPSPATPSDSEPPA